MERWQNRVAVVTGASSGIGAATAKDLVRAGFVVVGMARRVELIEALRKELPAELQSRLHAVKCDVGNQSAVDEAFDYIEKKLGGVDVLVNNAGTLHEGQLLTQDIAKLEQVIQVNIMGVVYCTRRAFASMQARQFAGHVILINSIVGHTVFNPPNDEYVQKLNIYVPSKHAITGMTEVLRQELRGLKTKIKVTSISPGAVDTDILPSGFEDVPKLRSEDISSGILYAISTPPHVQIHEMTIKPIGEQF